MKKGLTLTLLTVAIAMFGIQAMAEAPVMDDIPSPIVGGDGSVTGPNRFVYPDAIDLNNFVEDDNTADADLLWSYEIVGTASYAINGVASMNTSADDPNNPGSKRINNQDTDPSSVDSNPATITIRNIYLSPLDESNGANAGSTTGILDSQTQLVTLYCSDGESYDEQDVYFYTDNGGEDRLSTGGEVIFDQTFTGTPTGWSLFRTGSVTTATGATGLCFTSAAAGDNYLTWTSPELFQLTQNSVYEIRATMNSSAATAGLVPFWDMYIDNFGAGSAGMFGQDCYFLDGSGGANAVLNTAQGTDMVMWFAPIASLTPQWNNATTGAFKTANAGKLGARFTIRLLDIDDRVDIGAQNATGQLCLKKLLINKYDLGTMRTMEQNAYQVASGGFSAANSGGTGTTIVDSFVSPTISWTGGNLTVTPSTSGRTAELITVTPGRDLQYNNTAGNYATIADNFPVPWVGGTLYQVVIKLAAPDTNSQDNPYDGIQIGVDNPSNEVLMESLVTLNGGECAMPKTGAAQTYSAFWYSHNVSVSTIPQYKFFRPRFMFLNNQAFGLDTDGSTVLSNNSGGVTISGMSVNKVSFN